MCGVCILGFGCFNFGVVGCLVTSCLGCDIILGLTCWLGSGFVFVCILLVVVGYAWFEDFECLG